MRARFADDTILHEVTASKKRGQPRGYQFQELFTHMVSAFWIVDNLWAMAIVVRPFAAWSRAACTTFSELESSAEVA